MTNIKDVFLDCQKGMQTHGKLVKTLAKIYDSMPLEDFWEKFMHLLRYSLVVFKREPPVERTLEFAAKFATSFVGKESKDQEKNDKEGNDVQDGGDDDETDDEEGEEIHPFLLKLFQFVLENHNACDRAVRYRCCQMVNKLLNNMGEEAQIDDILYDKIYECMLQRLRDKFPSIRVQAVFALSRLQDPTDQDCPIINAYLFLLGCDTNVDVRRAVLSCIAASTKTLVAVLERTRDTKDSVRKLAFQVIAEKVHIKALTIAQRVKLLQDGLQDRVDAVRDSCNARLLQAWLRTCEGNILELLKCLDVENSLKTAEVMLEKLFSKVPAHELVQNFDQLNEELTIPLEEISCESTLYWQSLCEYLKKQGTSGEDQLEKILPTAAIFSKYVEGLFDALKGHEDVEQQLRNEFMMQQLLGLAGCLELADEVGRRHMGKLVHDLLVDDKIPHTLVKQLLSRYVEYEKDPESRVNQLVEIISEIREPITVVENSQNKEERRQLDLKLAGIRVELNQMREELESCIQAQDFSKAAELKVQVTELEEKKASLMEESIPKTQEIRTEKNDPDTLLKCLTIAYEMLQEVSFNNLPPALRTLIEVLILPGIQNRDPAVRNMAVKALGLSCLLHSDTAKEHLLLFMQVSQVDQEGVKVTALQVIFDLLHTFGLEAFNVSSEEEQDNVKEKASDESSSQLESSLDDSAADDLGLSRNMEKQSDETPAQLNTATSVLQILIGLLDSEVSDVRTIVAEGLAKLLLSGRIVSPKLLSRLLILWYNPITEDDTHLRHCLGAFFPVYAFAHSSCQEVMEEAVMPTLNTLFDAPVSSPLTEVNVNNVAELLVQFTNQRHLLANRDKAADQQDSCPHDSLSVKVCNAILSDPNSFHVKTLSKLLTILEPSPFNTSNLKDLVVLAEQLTKTVKEKQCLRMLEKFHKQIKDMLKIARNKEAESGMDSACPVETDDPEVEDKSVDDGESCQKEGDKIELDPVLEEEKQITGEKSAEQVVEEVPEVAADVADAKTVEGVNPAVVNTDAEVAADVVQVETVEEVNPAGVNTDVETDAYVTADEDPGEEDERPKHTNIGVDLDSCETSQTIKKKTPATARRRAKRDKVSSDSEEEPEVYTSPTPIRRMVRTRCGRKKEVPKRQAEKLKLEELLTGTDTQSENESQSPASTKRTTRSTRSSRSRNPLGNIENEVTAK